MSAEAAPLSPADQLVAIVAALHRAVGARLESAGVLGAVLALLWNRLGRLADAIARTIERLATPPAPRPSTPAIPPARAKQARKPAKRQRLPQRFAWMVELLGLEAAAFGPQLVRTLEDSEVRALLRASPQLCRLLSPLCRGLGVPVPPELRNRNGFRPQAVGPILPVGNPGDPPKPYVPPPLPAPAPAYSRDEYFRAGYVDPADPRFVERIKEAERLRSERGRWVLYHLVREI